MTLKYIGKDSGPSAKDRGLTSKETRVLSDAELIKGGARYQDAGRLEVTPEHITDAEKEMNTQFELEALNGIEKLLDRARNAIDSFDPRRETRAALRVLLEAKGYLSESIGRLNSLPAAMDDRWRRPNFFDFSANRSLRESIGKRWRELEDELNKSTDTLNKAVSPK